jgi:hypothetical protein
VNLNRLTLGGRIVAIAGLLLFVDSLLPWFRFCLDFGAGKACASHNGWNNVLTLLATLLAIALVVEIVLEVAGRSAPTVGALSWAQVQLGVGAVVALFVLLQVIIGDDGAPRYIGAYIGLVLAAGLVYGTYLRYREPAAQPFRPGSAA